MSNKVPLSVSGLLISPLQEDVCDVKHGGRVGNVGIILWKKEIKGKLNPFRFLGFFFPNSCAPIHEFFSSVGEFPTLVCLGFFT